MGISKEELAQILNGKARELCNSTEMLDKIAENQRKGGVIDPDPNSYDDYGKYDEMYSLSANEGVSSLSRKPMTVTKKGAQKSKLPSVIKESMINNPIQTNNGESILDSINVQVQQKPIKEQTVVQKQYMTNNTSSLKSLIMECLDEYFSKKNINESALKTITIKNGCINLIDNSGAVYNAKLKKIE